MADEKENKKTFADFIMSLEYLDISVRKEILDRYWKDRGELFERLDKIIKGS
jgi:hypothetical protein